MLDAAVHAIAIVASIIAITVLLVMIAQRGLSEDFAAVAVYATGLLAMLACSAAYNAGRDGARRELLQVFDHSAIFVMVAGTYTPFAVRLQSPADVLLAGTVWSVAAFGIAFRLLSARAFARVSLAFYIVLGWIGVGALGPLIRSFEPAVLALLTGGGVLYTVGTAFHVRQELRFQNAIWHTFVTGGAALHFAAVSIAVLDGRGS